ncbi:hypothetical protein AVEN_28493-1 [Araneus ventricosus]|uniref:Uncharacterized protein n=1 Tax=Araneus ventricosus TaxID=182803 RepID=A0A4Y2UZ07_ARAVE|nr:hypothetical protein AVEN_28493-1 [Araneus ventricosus]
MTTRVTASVLNGHKMDKAQTPESTPPQPDARTSLLKVTLSHRGSKLRGPFQNSSHVASKWDVKHSPMFPPLTRPYRNHKDLSQENNKSRDSKETSSLWRRKNFLQSEHEAFPTLVDRYDMLRHLA